MKRSTLIFLLAVWIVLLAIAFYMDRAVAEWVHDAVPFDSRKHWIQSLKWIVRRPGYFGFTLCIAPFLGLFHPRRWTAAAALLLSGVLTGINPLIKWIAGRHRPVKVIAPFDFHPFPQGIVGLWREPSLSFPSGDTTLAFATAASLAFLMPHGRWFFFVIASLVAAERVLENAHYLSDVVVGAGLGGMIGYWITRFVMTRMQNK